MEHDMPCMCEACLKLKGGTPAHMRGNPNHNNTTEIEKAILAWAGEGRTEEQIHGVRNFITSRHYTTHHQNLIIKERQAELAQTILAGMPGLTPTQQDFVTNRIQELQKELEANE